MQFFLFKYSADTCALFHSDVIPNSYLHIITPSVRQCLLVHTLSLTILET